MLVHEKDFVSVHVGNINVCRDAVQYCQESFMGLLESPFRAYAFPRLRRG
jgi:hypothetical protein